MDLRYRLRLYFAIGATILGLSLVTCIAEARAQAPDRRGETVTAVPEHNGERAGAPIPPKYHVRNEGGSDGQGLCVISSVLANGQYQGVPGFDVRPIDPKTGQLDMHLGQAGKGSQFWRDAKNHPGGYGPDKLEALIQRNIPGEKYASLLNASPEDLDRLSRKGYPIGGTMAWGHGYPGRISHMISLVHYRKDGQACVLDNNFPGEYHWMSSGEYDARFRANGSWAFVWTRLPPLFVVAGMAMLTALVLLAIATIQMLAAGGLLAVPEPNKTLPPPEFDPYFNGDPDPDPTW